MLRRSGGGVESLGDDGPELAVDDARCLRTWRKVGGSSGRDLAYGPLDASGRGRGPAGDEGQAGGVSEPGACLGVVPVGAVTVRRSPKAGRCWLARRTGSGPCWCWSMHVRVRTGGVRRRCCRRRPVAWPGPRRGRRWSVMRSVCVSLMKPSTGTRLLNWSGHMTCTGQRAGDALPVPAGRRLNAQGTSWPRPRSLTTGPSEVVGSAARNVPRR
jgi:hypothetical protein